ncbi:MAG: response regulator, partial [Planctomycetota bacterium]
MNEPLRLLIIEDDADTRANLRDILELDGHHVRTFATVADACDDPDMGLGDVLIMDRKLPDGMAEDLLPQLKGFVGDCDIIVITGFADMHAAIAAMREGVSDYLIKPIDPEALRTSLARIAAHRQVTSELYRQRRFAEMLLETAEAVVLVLNLEGKVKRANPYLLHLTGWSLEEVIDQDWFDLFVPDRDRTRIREVFGDTLRFDSHGIVNPVKTRDGSEREIRWSNKVLRDSDG